MDWGTGLPVVLLAGWVFNWTIWGEHIAALTVRGFRCVALDRRSHGRSDAQAVATTSMHSRVTWRRSLKSAIGATSSLLTTPWVLSWRFVT
jgi:pimeloyl-ACP methyl ester carboxylesterase